jgi:hypothetical protein
MPRNSIINWIFILLLLPSLSSCSKAPALSPQETVKLYLDELAIFKDPIYKKAALDKLEESEELERYKEAVQTIKRLIWTDKSSLQPEKRKSLLVAAGAMFTYKDYILIDEKIYDNKAFVTVVFQKMRLFGADLGKAGQQQGNKPVNYELIKTREGWKIKDIDRILAKRGF